MKKRGQIWENLLPWLVLIGFIFLVLFFYFVISGKLGGIGETIRTWLGIGR